MKIACKLKLLLALVLVTASAASTAAAKPYSHLFSVFRNHPDLHSREPHHVNDGHRRLAHHAAAIEINEPDTSFFLSYEATEHRDASHHIPLLSPEIARSVAALACGQANITVSAVDAASAAQDMQQEG